MKIITPGKAEVEMWPYTARFKCFTCGCEFKLEQGDKYRTEHIDSNDQREDGDWAHADCPNCGRDVAGYPSGYVR
jgi:hypothetical protein